MPVRPKTIVALKFVVDLRRGLQLFFQTVGADQGGRTVHLIEIPDRFGNLKKGSGIIQLLLDEFFTEHTGKFLGFHGFMGVRIQQRGRLHLHVGTEIIPCLGHLGFVQVDLVGNGWV